MRAQARIVSVGAALLAAFCAASGCSAAPKDVAPPLSAQAAPGATYYASPAGGGDGRSEAAPFKVKDFWPVAQPGDTLLLLDGTYADKDSLIRPDEVSPKLSGTPDKPITVKAMHDGQVLVDGSVSYFALRLGKEHAYFIIEGVNFCEGKEAVLRAGGNHNIVRRCCVWSTNSDISHILSVEGGTYNLIEDCAAWGKGRKTISTAQGGDYDTLRRVWARWEAQPKVNSKPQVSIEPGYNSIGFTVENAIATLNLTHMHDGHFEGCFSSFITGLRLYYALAEKTPPGRLLGCIGYVPPRVGTAGGSVMDLWGQHNFLAKHVVAYVAPGIDLPAWRCANYFVDGDYDGKPITKSIPQINVRVEDSVGIGGNGKDTFDSQWKLTNLRRGATVQAVLDQAKAPTLYDLVPGIGYRYVDGVLQDGTNGTTAQPLWPWPMDQRIKAALAFSGYRSTTEGLTGVPPGMEGTVTGAMIALFGPIPEKYWAGK